jgi:N-acetylneuraminic acid mutarotase
MLPKAPIGGRVGHTAVWTGREMLIWGGAGDLDSDPLTDGAAYDPATDRWRAVPPAPLTARFDPAAVWTGQEVLIFGGTSASGDILADGAAWNPASNAWRPLPSSPLGPRDGAVVAWAGDRLVVWSGATVPPAGSDGPSAGEMPDHGGSEMPADGSAYVPASDRWIPVPAAPIPGRSGAESVWTGTRLVVAGGYHEGDDDDRTDGAAFDPVRGVWSPIAPRRAPASCGGEAPCDGVWTGTAALFPASGVVYDPVTDRWSALAPYPPEQGPLSGEPAVWTGRRLLAWGSPGGGSSDAAGSGADSADGGEADADIAAAPPAAGMYDPGADRWQALAPGPLSGRVLHSAIWTGQEMLIWGGTAGDAGLADGAAFRPGD